MIGKFETNKDLIQELTSSGARRVGNIAGIITGTVAEVTREIGEWITDAIEMNEAAAAARRDAATDQETDPAADTPERDEKADEPLVFDAEHTPTPPATDIVDADVVDAEITDPPRPGTHS